MSDLVPQAAIDAATAALNREGGEPGNSIHSWRCEDTDRHPQPCDCARVTARIMLEAAAPHIAAQALRDAADSESYYDAHSRGLLRDRADSIEGRA